MWFSQTVCFKAAALWLWKLLFSSLNGLVCGNVKVTNSLCCRQNSKHIQKKAVGVSLYWNLQFVQGALSIKTHCWLYEPVGWDDRWRRSKHTCFIYHSPKHIHPLVLHTSYTYCMLWVLMCLWVIQRNKLIRKKGKSQNHRTKIKLMI